MKHEDTPQHRVDWWLGDSLTVVPVSEKTASNKGLGQVTGAFFAENLFLNQTSLNLLVKNRATPLYVYSAEVIRKRIREVRNALSLTGGQTQIYYALKANRFEGVIQVIRKEGDVGIDTCSPNEVQKALSAEFKPHEISFTGSMLSNADLIALSKFGVHLNLDSFSVLRRLAQLPLKTRKIGLRVDPGVQVGWGSQAKLAYGKSKFGFEWDTLQEAARYAKKLGFEVDQLHLHPGWGLQESAAEDLGRVYATLAEQLEKIPSIQTFNIGGGLSWKQRAQDEPLKLSTWSQLIRDYLVPTGRTIACELGTYLVASAGVLLAEVNTVENRPRGKWIGLNVGHNTNCYAAHYQIPHAIIPILNPLRPAEETVNIAGNINESVDVFAQSCHFPNVQEGEIVAFYPAGAYGSSMSSNHCMRGSAQEVMID